LQVEINSENLPTTTTPIATARPPKHEYQIPVMKLLVIECCGYILIIIISSSSRQAGFSIFSFFLVYH
jgi:uncharacterized oligopeptide transporter (OPT) family protein